MSVGGSLSLSLALALTACKSSVVQERRVEERRSDKHAPIDYVEHYFITFARFLLVSLSLSSPSSADDAACDADIAFAFLPFAAERERERESGAQRHTYYAD